RDLVVVRFVGLAEIGGVRVRNRTLLAHPRERGARVESAGERDADLLAGGQGLQDGRHRASGIRDQESGTRESKGANRGFYDSVQLRALIPDARSPMPSFDVMCEPNAVELKNAVDTANKEIANRYDFKGSDARIELKEKEKEVTLYADDDFKLGQVRDVLYGKMAKRSVDTRFLKAEDAEKIGGDKVKQKMVVRSGVEIELAKRIVKMLKDAKLKVTASIQGDAVRVSGAKKDDLQSAIQLVRGGVTEVPLSYQNFRD